MLSTTALRSELSRGWPPGAEILMQIKTGKGQGRGLCVLTCAPLGDPCWGDVHRRGVGEGRAALGKCGRAGRGDLWRARGRLLESKKEQF